MTRWVRIQAFKIRIQAFKIRIQAFKIRLQAFKIKYIDDACWLDCRGVLTFSEGNAHCLKALFHSSQNPTRKLAASLYFELVSQYLKALAVSLRVGFCDEWKRGLIQPPLKFCQRWKVNVSNSVVSFLSDSDGHTDHILPVCGDTLCKKSEIHVRSSTANTVRATLANQTSRGFDSHRGEVIFQLAWCRHTQSN